MLWQKSKKGGGQGLAGDQANKPAGRVPPDALLLSKPTKVGKNGSTAWGG